LTTQVKINGRCCMMAKAKSLPFSQQQQQQQQQQKSKKKTR
jgi:hypothetical protein